MDGDHEPCMQKPPQNLSAMLDFHLTTTYNSIFWGAYDSHLKGKGVNEVPRVRCEKRAGPPLFGSEPNAATLVVEFRLSSQLNHWQLSSLRLR